MKIVFVTLLINYNNSLFQFGTGRIHEDSCGGHCCGAIHIAVGARAWGGPTGEAGAGGAAAREWLCVGGAGGGQGPCAEVKTDTTAVFV